MSCYDIRACSAISLALSSASRALRSSGVSLSYSSGEIGIGGQVNCWEHCTGRRGRVCVFTIVSIIALSHSPSPSFVLFYPFSFSHLLFQPIRWLLELAGLILT